MKEKHLKGFILFKLDPKSNGSRLLQWGFFISGNSKAISKGYKSASQRKMSEKNIN